MADIENKPKELTVDHVKKIFNLSESSAASWHPTIKSACDEKQINTVYRLAAFLAQVNVETGGLKRFVENLNYSSNRLLEIFPKYFKSREEADAYAGQPEKIANKVYANRMGNGDEASGDGWRYRGRGGIQLTGKSNYDACTRGGVSCLGNNSKNLEEKEGAIKSAAWFWGSKGLNRQADNANFKEICLRVNGGTNGYSERVSSYERNLRILSDLPDDAPVQVDPDGEGENKVKAGPNRDNPEYTPTPETQYNNISEPIVAGRAEYPWNQAHESRSGHLIEIDDTPGSERLHWYHRTGTYTEMQPEGDHVTKSVKDKYVFVNQNDFWDVGGDQTTKIAGTMLEKIGSTKTTKVGSTYFIEAPESLQVNTPEANFSEVVNCKILSAKYIRMARGAGNGEFGNVADIKSRDSCHADYSIHSTSLGYDGSARIPGSWYGGNWAYKLLEGASSVPGGKVSFNPYTNELGSSTVNFNQETHETKIRSAGDLTTYVQGGEETIVNGDISRESGGDVEDTNLGSRKIASGEQLDLCSDTKVKVDAPEVEIVGAVMVSGLMFKPVSSVDSLPKPPADSDGATVLYMVGSKLKSATSDGSRWIENAEL